MEADLPFGERFTRWRIAFYETDADCARETAVHYNQIAKFQAGIGKPSFDLLTRFASAKPTRPPDKIRSDARLNIHWLVTGQGTMLVVPEMVAMGEVVEDAQRLKMLLIRVQSLVPKTESIVDELKNIIEGV